MVKTSSPGALSPQRLLRASKTSSSEKGSSKLLELSLPKILRHKPLMVGLPSLDFERRVWKALRTPSLISSTLVKRAPLTLTLVNKLFLLWAMAILWKSLMFLSPPLNQISLAFWLHEDSSIKSHFLNSSKANLLASANLGEGGETELLPC